MLKGDGNTAEAIPLYADWIPQANGFAASPVNPQDRESPEGVTRDGKQMTKTEPVASAPLPCPSFFRLTYGHYITDGSNGI